MPSIPYPVSQQNRPLTALAWIVTILISVLPDAAWFELTQGHPFWLFYAKMGLLLCLTCTALFWKPLRPLLAFFFVMFAFFGLFELQSHLNFTSHHLQSVFGSNVFDARMQAEQTGKLCVSSAMIALLLVIGFKRREIFLTAGNLTTSIEPVRVLGFPKSDPWPWFGFQWSVYIAAGLAAIQYLGLRPVSATITKILPLVPSILFYAGLNAFSEEIMFRVPMLATLESIGGSRQALWLSAYFFGFAHYFGTPHGIMGAAASIFMGWILGKAMIETRGLLWSWWIHFLSDIAIFSFLAMSL